MAPRLENPTAPNAWLSPQAAAEIAGVDPRTVVRWTARYPALAVRVGGRWRIDADALRALLRGDAA